MERFYQAVEIEKKAAAELSLARNMRAKLNANKEMCNDINSDQSKQTDSIKIESTNKSNEPDEETSRNRNDYSEKIHSIESDQMSSSEIDEEFDRDLRKEIQESEHTLSINVHESFPSALYEEDYTDSTASTASLSNSASTESIEQFMNTMRASSSLGNNSRKTSMNDELETYHPRMESPRALSPPSPRALSPTPYRTPEPGQAAVILTKPLPLPDPDYVPKPILKRPSIDNSAKENDTTQDEQKNTTNKTEKKKFLQLFDKKKTPSSEDLKKSPSPQSKQNSTKNENETKATAPNTKTKAKEAEKVKMLQRRQSSIEENKVAADHYNDLVRELGGLKKPKVPLYMDSEALSQYAAKEDDEESEMSPVVSKEQLNQSVDVQKSNESIKQDPSKDYVEISVEQTKSISYLVREIKHDQAPSNEPVSSPTTLEAYVSSDGGSSAGMISKRKPFARMRSTSSTRSRQRESPSPAVYAAPRRPESRTRVRSQSKSPASQQRTSLTSTVLKVQRFPIRDANSVRRSPSVSPVPRTKTPEQLFEEAEVKVKSSLTYATDFTMFLLACWLYMFKDARLAIPILVLMVYRQVKNALEKKLPTWKVN